MKQALEILSAVFGLAMVGLGFYSDRLSKKLRRRTVRLVTALKDCQNMIEVENFQCGTENFNAQKNVGRRTAAIKTGREVSEQCQPAQLRKLIERFESDL